MYKHEYIFISLVIKSYIFCAAYSITDNPLTYALTIVNRVTMSCAYGVVGK